MRRGESLALVLFLTAALAAGPNSGATAYNATLNLSPDAGPSGTTVNATGSGYAQSTPVEIHWETESGTLLATTNANGAGEISVSFEVPTDDPGAHYVVACSYVQGQIPCDFNSPNHIGGRDSFTISAPATPTPTPTPTSPPATQPPVTEVPPSTQAPVAGAPPTKGTVPTTLSGGLGKGIFGTAAQLSLRRNLAIIPEGGVVPRCAPREGSTVLDFDDLPEGSDPFEAYADRGVGLREGYNKVERPAPGTISAPFAVVRQAEIDPQAFISFSSPQRYVGIHVGSPSGLRTVEGRSYGSGGPDGRVRLTAYDDSPASAEHPFGESVLVGEDSVERLGSPSPATTCMLVAAEGPVIDHISIQAKDGYGSLAVDRLFFSATEAYPSPPPVKGSLYIRSPREEQHETLEPLTVSGDIRGVRQRDGTVRGPDRTDVMWIGQDGSSFHSAEARTTRISGESWGFSLEGVHVPPGKHAISATATGVGFFATDSVVVEGTGPSFAEYDEIIRQGRYDIVPLGLEVTQGIRPQLSPSEPGTVNADLAVHVAERRTVVRGFAYIDWMASQPVRPPPVAASLYGFRAGRLLPEAPLAPVNGMIMLSEVGASSKSELLQGLRLRPAGGWNFVLPASWTTEGSVSLRLEVNPAGIGRLPEGGGSANNAVTLDPVRFASIGPRDVYLNLLDFAWREGGNVRTARVEFGDLFRAFDYWYRTFPVPDGGLRVVELRGDRTTFGAGPRSGDVAPDPPIAGYPPWDSTKLHGSFSVTPPTYEGHSVVITSPQAPMGCGGRASLPGISFWSAACSRPMAQEPGHNFGIDHWSNAHGEAGGGGYQDRFTGDHGEVEGNAVGFDIMAMQPVAARQGSGEAATHTHDFMSYGADPGWVSLRTWNDIAAALQDHNGELASEPRVNAGSTQIAATRTSAAPPARSEDDFLLAASTLRDVLLLTGSTNRSGGSLDPAFLVADPGAESRSLYEGDNYRLVLTAADGEIVASESFDPAEATHSTEEEATFAIPTSPSPRLARAELFRGEERLVTRTTGPGAPRVSITEPKPGTAWGATGEADVSWRADDPDDDRLTYRVEVSADGERWIAVAGPAGQPRTTIDLASLPVEGEDIRLRVQASDGLNVGTAEVERISSALRAPRPLIMSPADGSFVPLERVVKLVGSGVTGSGGRLSDEALTWFVDGELIGSGREAWAAGLDEGEHQVVLRAEQKGHPKGEEKITLLVSTDRDHDQLPDNWESDNELDPADASDPAGDPDDDTLANWQEFQHGADPRKLDTDDDRYADAVEVEGGSDPADPDSIPLALHGGRPVPRLPGPPPSKGLTWWVWAAAAVVAGFAVASALLLRQRRRRVRSIS